MANLAKCKALPRNDSAVNKPIPTAILRNLVAASLLFASSMLLEETRKTRRMFRSTPRSFLRVSAPRRMRSTKRTLNSWITPVSWMNSWPIKKPCRPSDCRNVSTPLESAKHVSRDYRRIPCTTHLRRTPKRAGAICRAVPPNCRISLRGTSLFSFSRLKQDRGGALVRGCIP